MRFVDIRKGRFYFYNEYIFLIGFEEGVILKFDQDNSDLSIVGNFNIYNTSYSNVAFYKKYMILSADNGAKTTDVYDISDLSHIREVVAIPYAGNLSVDQQNGILFIGDNKCKVFDLSNIDNHDIRYLTEVKYNSSIVKLFSSQNQNENYLWLVGETSVTLYSYNLK